MYGALAVQPAEGDGRGEQAPIPIGGVDEQPAGFERDRQRLLDQDVYPGVEAGNADDVVQTVGQADVDRVHPSTGDEVFPRAVARRLGSQVVAYVGGGRRQVRFDAVADRRHLEVVEAGLLEIGEARQVPFGGNAAAADDAQADRLL